MEFQGFQASDFDFFRKKDKMQRVEYEKGRNDIKHHFRSLLYEFQKLYHSETSGVLNLDKEFQNFTKKSTLLMSQIYMLEGLFKCFVSIDSDRLIISSRAELVSTEDFLNLSNSLKQNRNDIINFAADNKNFQLCVIPALKHKNIQGVKFSSIDITGKNLDSLQDKLMSMEEKKVYPYYISFDLVYTKMECVKLSKGASQVAYKALKGSMGLTELFNN